MWTCVSNSRLVTERLTVAAYVIDKMRAAVPVQGRGGKTVIGEFAVEHEEMVNALCALATKHFVPLAASVEPQRMGRKTNRVLVCEWGGKLSAISHQPSAEETNE